MEIDPDSIDRDEISELGDGLLLDFLLQLRKKRSKPVKWRNVDKWKYDEAKREILSRMD